MVKHWKGLLAAVAAGLPFLLSAWPSGQAQPPGAGDTKTASGVVKDFTTAPKGEIDGAVLGEGTVLHWPPHLADRFSAGAAQGDRVKAVGWMDNTPDGLKLEVRTLTNLRTGKSADNDGPPPPGARRAAAERAGGREQRLRELEDQVRELQKEIE